MRALLRTRDGQTTGLRNGESLRSDRTRGQSDDTDGQTEIGKGKDSKSGLLFISICDQRKKTKLESTKERCVTVKRREIVQ